MYVLCNIINICPFQHILNEFTECIWKSKNTILNWVSLTSPHKNEMSFTISILYCWIKFAWYFLIRMKNHVSTRIILIYCIDLSEKVVPVILYFQCFKLQNTLNLNDNRCKEWDSRKRNVFSHFDQNMSLNVHLKITRKRSVLCLFYLNYFLMQSFSK